MTLGKESFKLRFFVGHDGTMIRVASALGLGKISPLRWPALGSEIVMEVSVDCATATQSLTHR